MYLNRALRALLLCSILFLGSFLSPLLIIPASSTDMISGETTFYFKNALSLDFEDQTDLGIIPISQEKPTQQNDSFYPPSLLKENTSKTFFKRELNSDDMLYWMTAWTFYLLDELDDNLSDIFGDLFGDLEGFEILFPHPFRIVEIFEYEGNETLEIKSDIVFDLYFSSSQRQRFRPKYRDEVKVGLYSMGLLFPLPKEIKNVTQQIKAGSLLQNGISKQKIILENVNHTLKPGESLLFSIELIQSDKSNLIGSIIKSLIDEEKFLNRWKKRGNYFENMSNFPNLQDLGTLIRDLIPLLEEFNFTIDDIAKFFDTFRSSSLVYDSETHPSSVTMEFILPGEDENTKMYYLHKENKMDTIEPSGGKNQKAGLSNVDIKWEGPVLDERNKIIKDVSADLYIHYINFLNPGKIKVAVTLYDGDNEISSDPVIKVLDRSNIQAQTPTTFTFQDVNYELEYGHSLGIRVSLSNNSKPSFRKVSLLFDSNEKPSSVKVIFKETDNIKFDYVADPIDTLIVPGGSVKYTLNISSKTDDEITVDVLEDKKGDWELTYVQDQLKISAGETISTHIFVNSTNKEKEAYGSTIDLTIIIRGKTGIDRKIVSAGISESAIKYDLNIVNYTKSKYINKGKNGTLYLIIENNNTGAEDDVDSYTITAISNNNWNVKPTDLTPPLKIGERTKPESIFVIVSVPKNTTKKSDNITITVTSNNNDETYATIYVKVKVIGSGILGSIYEFFESASNTLGLDEMFGTYAPIALVSLLMIVILFIIIIFVLLLTRKFVNIICTERIKEIDPNEKASFEITLNNPTKKVLTYEISTDNNPSLTKWEKSLEIGMITVDGHQNKIIHLTVKPTEHVKPNDWTETKVKVNILGKHKSDEITTMTMVKEGKTLLKITDVYTWPKEFKKGDRLITSFKLENKGSISAKNVLAVLYINGKEKNKVEVTIPGGGYADIKIPWIALKGKNKLHIKAIEQ